MKYEIHDWHVVIFWTIMVVITIVTIRMVLMWLFGITDLIRAIERISHQKKPQQYQNNNEPLSDPATNKNTGEWKTNQKKIFLRNGQI